MKSAVIIELLSLGCPFRHWDVSSLRTRLQQVGLGHKGVMEVLNKVEGGHYQIACRLVFELTHPVSGCVCV